MTARKIPAAETTWTSPASAITPPSKPRSYVKGSHAARVRAEQDERRVELLALHDVLSAQRDGLNDQIEDIVEAIQLLSEAIPSAPQVREPIEMAA